MKDIQKVTVFLNDDPVGTVQMVPGKNQCAFEYSQEWIARGFSISPWELPLQKGLIFSKEDTFNGGFAAFEDSLPDGYGLYLIDRMLKKEGSSLKALSPLQRLSLIGGNATGALRYEPVLGGKMGNIHETELDLVQGKALDILSGKDEGDASLLYYKSGNSGGARPKALLRRKDGSMWIVKFRHTYDPIDIGKTEYLYMATAEKCGISIPRTRLLKDKYFSIERFDIVNGKRIHMLSASALLQSDFRIQGIDYSNLLALTGYLTQDSSQVEQMFRRMVFNIVADNKDDHGKNFSFLCENGKWSLSPAYDLTYSPEGTRGERATSVMYNGKPTLADVLSAGTGIRISKNRCMDIISEIETVCKEILPHSVNLLDKEQGR